MKNNQGFTLIEVLVSMTLLSSIIFLATSAFGFFAQRWNSQLSSFDLTMQNARNYMLVQGVLGNLVPYVAFNEAGKPIIYFEGNRNGFVAVASDSIFKPDSYAVVRLSVSQREDLTFNVIYEEWPMDYDVLVSIGQPLPFSEPLVLFDSVKAPLFEYYGWPDISKRLQEEDAYQQPQWTSDFNGVTSLFMPLKVKLGFISRDGHYQIFATLADQKKGLLSRYSDRFQETDLSKEFIESE